MVESIRTVGGMLFSGILGAIPSVIWALTVRHLGSPSMRLGALLFGSALGVAFYFMKATWRAGWRNDYSSLVREEWGWVPRDSTRLRSRNLDFEHLSTYLKVPAVPLFAAASFPLLSLSLLSALHPEPLPQLLLNTPGFTLVYFASVVLLAWAVLRWERIDAAHLRSIRSRAQKYSVLAAIAIGTTFPSLYAESMRLLLPPPLIQQASWYALIAGVCVFIVSPTAYRFLVSYGVSESLSLAGAYACSLVVGVPPVVTIWREEVRPIPEPDPHIDGTKLSPVPPCLLTPQDWRDIQFGPAHIPFFIAKLHLLLIGSPQSGKTVLMRLAMQSALRGKVGAGKNHRAFVYDFKREWVQTLAGMDFKPRTEKNPDGLVIIIEPTDRRAHAWLMCKDIKDAVGCAEVAEALFPVDKNAKDKFFEQQVQAIAKIILISFMEAWRRTNGAFDYGLEDLIYTMRDLDRIKEVIQHLPEHVPDREDFPKILFETKEDVLRCIRSELGAKTDPYVVSAALWGRAKKEGRTFSLADWVSDPKGSIILLTQDMQTSQALKGLYNVIFKRVVTLSLALENSADRSTSFWLDEIHMAGFDDISSIMTTGPAKGVWACIAFQNQAAMRDTYDKLAEVIWGEPANAIYCRTMDHSTAQICEKQTGQERRWQISKGKNRGTSDSMAEGESWSEGTSISFGPNGTTSGRSSTWGGNRQASHAESKGESEQWSIIKAEAVYAAEFQNIPTTDFDTDESFGLEAVQRCPYSGDKPEGWTSWIHLSAWELRRNLMGIDKTVPVRFPRTNYQDQYLEAWDEKRWVLFKGESSQDEDERGRIRKRIQARVKRQAEREKEHTIDITKGFSEEDINMQ